MSTTMKFAVILFILPVVMSSFNEYWITPCGHVYKKDGHPLRVIRSAETLIRLKHQFKNALDFVTGNSHLGILEDLNENSRDAYVIQDATLDLYNHVNSVQKLMRILPLTYRTLQDLAFALKIVHDELTHKEDVELRKRHIAVKDLMNQNAQLLCELDYAMHRNNIEFSRIDQLTLSQTVTEDYNDFTFTHLKHSHILKEYRLFVKHVSNQILKLV